MAASYQLARARGNRPISRPLQKQTSHSSMKRMTETTSQWQINPEGFFSRHFDLFRDGETIASLQMGFWTEGCHFTLAGHEFQIERVSVWKDGFRLVARGESVCDVRRTFWSRQFELFAADEKWILQPTGWFTRDFHLLAASREVGRIQPLGWFTRKRVAWFSESVPLPMQVLAVFLVLLVSQRQQRKHAPGG
jgi:hypothetical protein